MRADPRFHSIARIATALAALVVAASCGPAASSPAEVPLEFVGLLERAAASPRSVAFSGDRRWTSRTAVGGVVHELTLLEHVAADGHGRRALEPVDVLGNLALPREMFLEQQRARAAFSLQYRDFEIRDLPLFLRNYEIAPSESQPVVAGRPCAEFTARRADGGGRTYRVALDLETGLVLAFDEHSEDGGQSVSMAYERIAFGEPQGTERWIESDRSLSVDPQSVEAGALGFAAHMPAIAPDGFALIEARVRGTAPLEQGPTLTLVYQDGVESVFVVQGDGLALDRTGTALGESGLPQGADAIAVWSFGPWTVVQGDWRGQHVLGLGKLDKDELRELVESTLPEPP